MTSQATPPTSLTDPSKNQLSEKDFKFIQTRQRFLKVSNVIGRSLFLFLGGLFLWLFFKAPNMINPFEVERQIASNTLPASTLKIMAVLFPLMVVMAFFLMASIILFGFWAFALERNYLKIIEGFLAGPQGVGKLSASAEKDLKETKKKNPAGKKK